MFLYAVISWISGLSSIVFSIIGLVSLSDLECNLVDGTTACNRLNLCFLLEIVANSCLVLTCLASNYIFLCFIPVFCLAYYIYRFTSRSQKLRFVVYDSMLIMNRKTLQFVKFECIFKVIISIVSFFIYFIVFLIAVLSE
uniref:Protein cornichon homolog 4 (Trinotate prediction) n=1 Tax=Henneguya salminicola TaxID=69463 RepID=A0A6G3MKQ1_HENSL